MNIVLFSQEEAAAHFLNLNDTRTKHILSILHKKEGDYFEAGIINKEAGKAKITQLTPEGLFFDFFPENSGKPLYPLIMLIGFPRPIQLKRLFRDMAGLGVKEIHLMGTELGEKSYRDSSIVEKGAAFEALKDGTVQAKSTHIPELFLHNSVKECLNTLKNRLSSSEKVLLDPKAPCSLSGYLSKLNKQSQKEYFAAIGSERGWTAKEQELFAEFDFTCCSMGERILRTETASTTAASLFLAHMEIL